MLTIGLIGGIASGKSTVGRLLAEQGAALIEADALAHEVLGERAVRDALVERWGPEILATDGQVNRRELAGRVFGEDEAAAAERRFLEGLVHPRVRVRLREAVQRHAKSGGRAAVLDVPLLLDVGWEDECDLVVMVDAPREARLARAAGRGWDAAELAHREAAQLPMSEKRRRADAVIENGGGLNDLREKVHLFWTEMVAPRLAERAP
jgi:dephospho-CoA kinase